MTRLRVLHLLALGLAAVVVCGRADALAQTPTVTIRGARVLDGKGGALANATVELKGDTIVKVDQRSGPVTYKHGPPIK